MFKTNILAKSLTSKKGYDGKSILRKKGDVFEIYLDIYGNFYYMAKDGNYAQIQWKGDFEFMKLENSEETTKSNVCKCDSTHCVKQCNIGKYCKYRKHIVIEEFLHG